MSISHNVSDKLEKSSWIRKMFEEGLRMKQEHGADNVFDLSLGNPVLEPPEQVRQAIISTVNDTSPGLHRYMPNAGLRDVRDAIARSLSLESSVKLTADHIVMVCGAAGGLNITLKTLLDPGEEVIVFSPFFVEYLFYSENHGGKTVIVPTDEDFSPNLDAFRDALSPKTKAIIINSPNNPTGVVYPYKVLQKIATVLQNYTSDTGRPIYLISDDPYKKIIFDGVETTNILKLYENSIYITSHSKDLALAGERIGYVAVNPKCSDGENLMSGLIFCNRVLGFVNAPALIQRAVKDMQNISIDAELYREKRDFLYKELTRIGYSLVKPQGAFYFFPKSPIQDELAFIKKLADKRVLVVPGRGFGSPGYFRISYCVTDKVLEGSIAGFEKAFNEAHE